MIMSFHRLVLLTMACGALSASAFVSPNVSAKPDSSALQMGLFDNFRTGGSGRDRLDEEWEKQQEILANRRKPKAERDEYFRQVEMKREEASKKQQNLWGWQTKTYGKGEDPLDEWKKRRAAGDISDLDDQYGDPKRIGGIPLPMASFGVGGEFGVGGKYDNGGRFDLRLPYADQGYVDDDADVMGKIGNFFGGGKKKTASPKKKEAKAPEEPKNAAKWPWEK